MSEGPSGKESTRCRQPGDRDHYSELERPWRPGGSCTGDKGSVWCQSERTQRVLQETTWAVDEYRRACAYRVHHSHEMSRWYNQELHAHGYAIVVMGRTWARHPGSQIYQAECLRVTKCTRTASQTRTNLFCSCAYQKGIDQPIEHEEIRNTMTGMFPDGKSEQVKHTFAVFQKAYWVGVVADTRNRLVAEVDKR